MANNSVRETGWGSYIEVGCKAWRTLANELVRDDPVTIKAFLNYKDKYAFARKIKDGKARELLTGVFGAKLITVK